MAIVNLFPIRKKYSRFLWIGLFFLFYCGHHKKTEKTTIQEKGNLVFKHMPRIIEFVNDTLLVALANMNTIYGINPETGYLYDYLLHRREEIMQELQQDSISVLTYFHKQSLDYHFPDKESPLFYKAYNFHLAENTTLTCAIGVTCAIKDTFPIRKDSLIYATINYKLPVIIDDSSIRVMKHFPMQKNLLQAAFGADGNKYYFARFNIQDTVLHQVLVKMQQNNIDTILDLGKRKDFFNIRFRKRLDTLFFNYENKILALYDDKLITKFVFPKIKEINNFYFYDHRLYVDAKNIKNKSQYVFFVYDIKSKEIIYTHKRINKTSYATFYNDKFYFLGYEEDKLFLNSITIDN